MKRNARTIISEDFVVATFPAGVVQQGQSEYAFSLDLP